MQTIARNPVMIRARHDACPCRLRFQEEPAERCCRTRTRRRRGDPGSQQDFTVNVGDRIFLIPTRHRFRADAQATLDRQAQWLANIRTTQSPSKAMPTSAAPANTTSRSAPAALRRRADYLVSRGVPGNRMRTISYGKEKPVAFGDDISCWSQNRRAVTVSAAPAADYSATRGIRRGGLRAALSFYHTLGRTRCFFTGVGKLCGTPPRIRRMYCARRFRGGIIGYEQDK